MAKGKQLTRADQNFISVRELFESAHVQKQLERALSSAIKMDQLIRVFLNVIRMDDKLAECSQQSLLNCVMGFGTLGLSPDKFLGQAYAVPFWNSKLNCNEATFIPGYRGYITLARRSGELASLSAQMVYTNDHFMVQMGLIEVLEHIPSEGDRGDFRGAWTVFNYRDHHQRPTFDYMPLVDLDKIRDRTKSKDRSGNIVGAWKTDPAEMYKKTVIRRHMKLAPLSVEDTRLMKAAKAEDLALGGEQTGFFLPDADETIGVIGYDPPAAEHDLETAFDEAVGLDIRSGQFLDPLMNDWLKVCAEGNNITVDQVKINIVNGSREDRDHFLNAFHQFKAKRAKQTGLKYPQNLNPTWADFRSKWINLRQNFKPFLEQESNIQLFRLAEKECPELYQEAREKFLAFFKDEDFPLDQMPGEVVYDPKGGTEADQTVKDASEGADTGGTPKTPETDPEPGSDVDIKGTSEYIEFMKMKTYHFKEFHEVTRGREPGSMSELMDMISELDRLIDDKKTDQE